MLELKPKITNNFIDLLASEPWSQGTLEKAAKQAGIDAVQAEILYPGKLAEFTNDFIIACNEAGFAAAREQLKPTDKIREKIEEIIFQRIKIYHMRLKSLEALRKFFGYAVNPANIGSSIKNIYEFSSEAWYEIGDRSTDFSYYTKRLSLSAIYSKSVLYSLTDKNNNLEATRKFIKKSIDALMKINKLKQKAKELKSYLPSFTKANR